MALVAARFLRRVVAVQCTARVATCCLARRISWQQRAFATSSAGPSLAECDPELNDIIEKERTRQWKCLELIASENFTSKAVMEAMGSVLTNKYSEGLPGARYYGGNQYVDDVERLCQKRALAAFRLDPKEWGVNVQPYSGSPANFAAYTALIQPNDRLMGLDLPSGGHLTHGFYRPAPKSLTRRGNSTVKVSATSIYFQSMPYRVNPKSGLVDYDELEKQAKLYMPQLIICGGSAYPREWDYARLRKIADSVSAYLLCDMAHVSGLVAAQVSANPFPHCHVVTSTTHKTLRGPRSGMIFYRRNLPNGDANMEQRVNNAVFPGIQGGPHNHTIAALAAQLKEVTTPEFKQYAIQVKKNAAALAEYLKSKGYKLVTGGTDNHLILWDLRPHKITGSKFEALCDECSITLNKNSIYGDQSAMTPGGVRIGSPALTSRGLAEEDFKMIGQFLHRALEIGLAVQATSGKKLEDFKAAIRKDQQVQALREDVEKFAKAFPMPGLDVSTLKYKD